MKKGTWLLLAIITALMAVIKLQFGVPIPWWLVAAPIAVPVIFYVLVAICVLVAIFVVLLIQKVSKPADSE